MKRLLSLVVLVISTQARADSDIAPPKEYTAAVEALEKFIKHELEDKNVPAISIALVDDQKVVYAKGFGLADPKEGRKASAATVYRVGSVSKLFTDLAVMQLVEQ